MIFLVECCPRSPLGLHGEGYGTSVEGVDLIVHSLADERFLLIVEPEFRDRRNLLDADNRSHG